MKKILFFATAFLICSSHLVFSETVSLSTYYPAPFGTYDRLRLVPRDLIAGNCKVGTMYTENVTNTLQYCAEAGNPPPNTGSWGPMVGLWENDGSDNISLVGTDDPTTFNVGINDSTPDAMLEVSNDGTAADLFMLSSDDGNDGDLFVVKSDGKVGIGTTAPLEKFTIEGAANTNEVVVQRININDSNGGAAYLRLTETNFRGGFLRYDNATNDFHIGVHNPSDTNPGNDTIGITIDRGTGDVSMTQDVSIAGDVYIGATVPASPEKLNVDGSINLKDDGANWGKLMVEYDSGNYYAVYAP